MNRESARALFDAVFGGGQATLATLPILMVSAGVVILMLSDVIKPSVLARKAIFAATLGAGFAACAKVLSDPPGLVLGDTFIATRATAVWGFLFLTGTGLSWVFSQGYYGRAESPHKTEHDLLLLIAPVGMMLMVGARDLIVFFIGLELLSIPLYALAAFQRGRARSVEAGLKYFLLGAFSTGFFLYGSALLFASTGTLSLTELAVLPPDALRTPLALGGVALIAASLFFKISVFPFHLWVPDVYQGSPTPVTALMATGTKAAAFGFLVPVSFLLPSSAAGLIAGIALVTMALGNLGALVQSDLKRMLAYSAVAHAGTLLLVLAGTLTTGELTGAATDAVLFYMAAYVFTAGGAFGLICVLEKSGEGATSLDRLRGLAGRKPGMAAALALFMLSLGGIPATGGFLGKWFVFSVLVRADMIGVAILGAVLSVVALGYYLRVIVVLYMQESDGVADDDIVLSPAGSGLATALCCAGVLLLGVAPQWFLNWLS